MAMPEIAHSDQIHRLEQRHIELIDALDTLNHQLELTLKRFAKDKHEKPGLTNGE